MPTVTQIVKKYLRENGYDGLCGDECGCGLDDFERCFASSGCVVGHKVENFQGEIGYRPGKRPKKKVGKK